MDAVVVGNVALDVICQTVDDVPRHESIGFENVAVTPGGCGSNVAIGLRALGVSTGLVACLGSGESAGLLERYWERVGLDLRFVRRVEDLPLAVSVGLVDSHAQPRFIHVTGANTRLTPDDLDVEAYAALGVRALHVAGYFVLPGLLDERLAHQLSLARRMGILTSLDVVTSPRMEDPTPLWPCLPHLDILLCNAHEAERLTGLPDPMQAARALRERGLRRVIVKLGANGCLVDGDDFSGRVEADPVKAVDTTGGGDAFAAGLVAAMLRGEPMEAGCRAGNAAGRRMVGVLGAVAGWLRP